MDREVLIDAPSEVVWSHLSDLRSHPEWMSDAMGIEFESEQTSGEGTRMRVLTRVGPFRTTDLMTVVEWEPPRVISVAHHGVICGTGRFEINSTSMGTTLIWSEDLRFPWWLGGFFGGRVARPVLRSIWNRNLDAFKDIVEGSSIAKDP